MKIWVNGVIREATPEEEKLIEEMQPKIPYKDRVVARIRERYSVNDEIQFINEKYEKPERYNEYRAYVERVKTEEKIKGD
jgi:hypothetical protein